MKLAKAFLFAYFLVVASFSLVKADDISQMAAELGQKRSTLSSAWFLNDPFQYYKKIHDKNILTGLDIELLKAIADEAKYNVSFQETPWSEQLNRIKSGEQDIAVGAAKTEERQKYMHYSVPFRQETNVLYIRKGEGDDLAAGDVSSLLELLKNKSFRLGVIDGYAYADSKINDFINDKSNRKFIYKVGNDYQNLKNLTAGIIDGFFADSIAASTIAWRSGLQKNIQEHPIKITTDLHIVFSKRTVSPSQVESFNQAITRLKARGEFSEINNKYIFPILLSQTIDSSWFLAIDMLGTIVFVLSGLLIAYQYKYDIFGAFVLASLPAVGGGVIRDLITNRNPIALIENPIYIIIVIIMVVVGYISLKLIRLGRSFFNASSIYNSRKLRSVISYMVKVLDAMGLAAFTVIGVVIALSTKSEPLWLWGPILATITGAGGGILRDVVRSDPEIPTLKGVIYPEIACLWGAFLSFYLIAQGDKVDASAIFTGVIITMVGAFTSRMLVVHFGLKSPRFGADHPR